MSVNIFTVFFHDNAKKYFFLYLTKCDHKIILQPPSHEGLPLLEEFMLFDALLIIYISGLSYLKIGIFMFFANH